MKTENDRKHFVLLSSSVVFASFLFLFLSTKPVAAIVCYCFASYDTKNFPIKYINQWNKWERRRERERRKKNKNDRMKQMASEFSFGEITLCTTIKTLDNSIVFKRFLLPFTKWTKKKLNVSHWNIISVIGYRLLARL